MYKKEIRLLNKLKITAFDLYKKGQLPHYLFIEICRFGIDTPKVVIDKFKYLTERYLRIEGYYKRFPEENKRAEDEIILYLKDKGLIQ